MESKIKYFVVGSFLVVFVALFLIVVLIIYKGFYKVEYKTYLIKTTYSVNGLELGSPVKYKGVNVGKVKHIEINWKNPSEVIIFVNIDKRLKIEGKVYATLGLQGITGLAYISLEEAKEPYPIKKENGYEIIPFKPSTFQEISDFIPTMLTEIHKLTKDLRKFVNSIDVKAINTTVRTANATLENLNTKMNLITLQVEKLQKEISLFLSDTRDTLNRAQVLIDDLNKTSKSIRETSEELKILALETQKQLPLISYKLNEISDKLNKTLEDIDKFVKKLNTDLSNLLIRNTTKPAPVER